MGTNNLIADCADYTDFAHRRERKECKRRINYEQEKG
jgi:hypothetical protein